MFVCVYLNPTKDKTLYFDRFVPGGTNRPKRALVQYGGKALNAARVLESLGAEQILTGAYYLSDGLPQGVMCDMHELRTGSARVNTKIVAGGAVTEINEAGSPVTRDDIALIAQRVRRNVREGDLVILSGSLPAGMSAEDFGSLIDMIGDRGARFAADTSGAALNEALKRRPLFIKPNIDELAELTGRKFDAPKELAEAARGLSADVTAISMGSRGALICNADEAWMARPLELKVASTVGAGDAMTAGICFALRRGIKEALRLGSACAAAAIVKEGTDFGSREDIERMLEMIELERIS